MNTKITKFGIIFLTLRSVTFFYFCTSLHFHRDGRTVTLEPRPGVDFLSSLPLNGIIYWEYATRKPWVQ